MATDKFGAQTHTELLRHPFQKLSSMKLSTQSWACLILLVLSIIRTIQLYRSSTASLRPSQIESKYVASEEMTTDDQYDEVEMGPKPDNLFYFVQVRI